MSMELTTHYVDPGHHRVFANGRPTAIYLNRSTGSGKEYGWWIDDHRLDYGDRRGTPYATIALALAALEKYVVLATNEWTGPKEILGLEEEVES